MASSRHIPAIRQRRFPVSIAEYPFKDHWLQQDGTAMHYLDEGGGPPVLLLHGNPTWSFLYRKVIRGLRGLCRAVAPDYPGFGLSDHPPGYGYTPREHAERVEALVDHLGLEDYVLVVHDWGGPIGMALANRQPERLAGLVILNSWCWPAMANAWLFSLIMGGWPLGYLLQTRCNFFVRTLVPWGIKGLEGRLPEVLAAYTAPFPTPASRRGTYVFPRSIRKARPWLEELEAGLDRLRSKPVELVWAMDDPAFGSERYIRRWLRHFPGAAVDRVADAGHYLPEDRPDRVVAAIRRVLDRRVRPHRSIPERIG